MQRQPAPERYRLSVARGTVALRVKKREESVETG